MNLWIFFQGIVCVSVMSPEKSWMICPTLSCFFFKVEEFKFKIHLFRLPNTQEQKNIAFCIPFCYIIPFAHRAAGNRKCFVFFLFSSAVVDETIPLRFNPVNCIVLKPVEIMGAFCLRRCLHAKLNKSIFFPFIEDNFRIWVLLLLFLLLLKKLLR